MLLSWESWRFNLGKFIKSNITIGIHSNLADLFLSSLKPKIKMKVMRTPQHYTTRLVEEVRRKLVVMSSVISFIIDEEAYRADRERRHRHVMWGTTTTWCFTVSQKYFGSRNEQ